MEKEPVTPEVWLQLQEQAGRRNTEIWAETMRPMLERVIAELKSSLAEDKEQESPEALQARAEANFAAQRKAHRSMMASSAMNGLLHYYANGESDVTNEHIVERAFAIADAMLEASAR